MGGLGAGGAGGLVQGATRYPLPQRKCGTPLVIIARCKDYGPMMYTGSTPPFARCSLSPPTSQGVVFSAVYYVLRNRAPVMGNDAPTDRWAGAGPRCRLLFFPLLVGARDNSSTVCGTAGHTYDRAHWARCHATGGCACRG